MTEYRRCEECGAVLVENLETGSVYCKMCGWSPEKESKEDKINYVG